MKPNPLSGYSLSSPSASGLRPRRIVSVPVLTPWLASHWVGAVTPVPAGLAKPLVGSLVHPVVRREQDFDAHLDAPARIGVREAIRSALGATRPDTGRRRLAMSAGAVAACLVVGSLATQPNSRWYRALDKPPWQPPPQTFGLVWTPLYATIAAVSAQHLTQLDREGRAVEATAYGRALGVNLTLNALWSVLFFRVRNLPVATAGAAALAASLAAARYAAAAASLAASLALVVRDLIKPGISWNKSAYDALTKPWRTVIGPIHLDDEDLR